MAMREFGERNCLSRASWLRPQSFFAVPSFCQHDRVSLSLMVSHRVIYQDLHRILIIKVACIIINQSFSGQRIKS